MFLCIPTQRACLIPIIMVWLVAAEWNFSLLWKYCSKTKDMKDYNSVSNTGFLPVDEGQTVSSQSERSVVGVSLQKRPTGVENEPSLAWTETKPLSRQIRFNYYFN